MSDIDPRLLEQIKAAGDDGQVEALVLLSDDGGGTAKSAAPSGDGSKGVKAGEGSIGQRLIEQVAHQVDEQPAEVRHMPLLGAVYVKGSARFVRQLLDSDQVIAASANDAEVTPLGIDPARRG